MLTKSSLNSPSGKAAPLVAFLLTDLNPDFAAENSIFRSKPILDRNLNDPRTEVGHSDFCLNLVLYAAF